jgi:hypothetical protein
MIFSGKSRRFGYYLCLVLSVGGGFVEEVWGHTSPTVVGQDVLFLWIWLLSLTVTNVAFAVWTLLLFLVLARSYLRVVSDHFRSFLGSDFFLAYYTLAHDGLLAVLVGLTTAVLLPAFREFLEGYVNFTGLYVAMAFLAISIVVRISRDTYSLGVWSRVYSGCFGAGYVFFLLASHPLVLRLPQLG